MVKIKFNNNETFYNATFKVINENIVELGNVLQNTSGFKAYIGDEVIGDYSNYTTVYRTLTNSYQLSNNGSVEPDKTVTIRAEFVNGENQRPTSVDIVTNKGNDTLQAPSFSKTYTIKISDDVNLVSAELLENFSQNIVGNLITYTYVPISPIPSLEQRIIDLEQAVCELYER